MTVQPFVFDILPGWLPDGIPNELVATELYAKAYGSRLEIFLDGVKQEYVYAYNVRKGYVDKHQMKAHNQGADVLYSPVFLGDKYLVNRLFGKVEVKWKS